MTYPSQKIREASTGPDAWIRSSVPLEDRQIQPASLDCRLGRRVYRVTSSFLPRSNETIEEVLKKRTLYDFELVPGSILERGASYIIPLEEELSLPPDVVAFSNPKSSIGRVDVFVRLLADKNTQFDALPVGYHGKLYLEVIPQSFIVAVAPGFSMNQIRFRSAGMSFIPKEELLGAHEQYGLLFGRGGQRLANDALPLVDSGLILGVDLSRERIGFRAKKNSSVVLNLTKPGAYRAEDFWDPIEAPASGELILEPGEFYLLATQERVSIPPPFAAEIMSYDPTFGEHRSHYAGFFDTGFGFDPSGRESGTTAVLEVRTHNVPFRITHGQAICRILYEKMAQAPDRIYGSGIQSHYTSSGPKLSKVFQNTW